jgi:hypothetical protein
MPVHFKILPQRNLVVFTYFGQVAFQEVSDVVAAAARHPDHRMGMRQLCDVSRVTGVERDFPALMKMQARIAEDLHPEGREMLVLFYAPTPVGKDIAQMARRSWEGLNSVIVLVQEQESEALALFGLPETSLTALAALEAK